MSRAKYVLNTRYESKNLKLHTFKIVLTVYFRSRLLSDQCFWSLFSVTKFFYRTVVAGHHFLAAKPSELNPTTKCVKVVVVQELKKIDTCLNRILTPG